MNDMDFSNMGELNAVLKRLLKRHPNKRILESPPVVKRHFSTWAIWDKGICILHTIDMDLIGTRKGQIFLFTDPDALPVWDKPKEDWDDESFHPNDGESVMVFSYYIELNDRVMRDILGYPKYDYSGSWL